MNDFLAVFEQVHDHPKMPEIANQSRTHVATSEPSKEAANVRRKRRTD